MSRTGLEALAAFFATSEVARRATRPLSAGAEVGLLVEGTPARFVVEARGEGAAAARAGAIRGEPALDPDFTLELPAGAVARLVGGPAADVGDLGIEFFRLVLERDPALRVHVHLTASTARLVARGYLAVLLLGGLKVAMWLLRKGVANPRAAIDRLRGR